jgi:hypothetical protein
MGGDDECLIEEKRHGIEIVVRGDDEAAFAGELGEKLAEEMGCIAIKAGEGFVQQKDVGILGEGAGEEGALLLATGKFADLAILKGGEGE